MYSTLVKVYFTCFLGVTCFNGKFILIHNINLSFSVPSSFFQTTFVLGIHGSVSKYDMETYPNGSSLVKIVFDPKSKIFGIFNFKLPVISVFDGISGTYSFSNPQTGGMSVLDERIKIAKYVHNNGDILKLFSNGVVNINYPCVFTYRNEMTKALAFDKKNLSPFPEHVYSYGNMTSDLYENPTFNFSKHFLVRDSFLNEMRLSFTKVVNRLRTLIANGEITSDMGAIGCNSVSFNKQTPLSKAIIKFLMKNSS